MTNALITTLIFDLGEVIVTNDWHYDCPEKFAEYSKYFGINYDQMETGWKAAWPEYKIGKISEDEFWQIFLKTAGTKNLDVNQAKLLWRKYQKTKPGTLNLLKKLKKYKLVALSNTGKEWSDFRRKQFKLDTFFSFFIISGYEGVAKPDKEIYLRVLNKLEKPPNECIFIDDTQSLLEPAQKLGIKTILFKNAALLENDLKKLTIM